MEKQNNFEDTEVLTPEAVKKQLQSGNLTEEQAIELCKRYMDSLEYTSVC